MASALVQVFVGGEWVPWDGAATITGNVTVGTIDSITNPVAIDGGGSTGELSTQSRVHGLLTSGPAVWETIRAASAANIGGFAGAVAGPGLLVNRAGDWVEFSDPGAATNAVATRAAVAAKSNVVTSISASVVAVNAQTPMTLRLQNGSGNTVWALQIMPATGQSREFQLSGLNIVMTANTAAVLRFNAAPAAGNFVTCGMTGYTLG
jgi:hypothetical protein